MEKFYNKINSASAVSTLGIKYPTYRDHILHTADIWLDGKRVDDGAEGLWRIQDNLYNFDKFVDNHPGGSFWLKVTKGTDITEAFEVHHIKTLPGTLLDKYFIKKATVPRNCPFTFKENGFYKTLKRNVAKELPNIPEEPVNRSKLIADILLVSYITTAILATYFWSYYLGIASGICLGLTTIAAHNFFHQRDNLRMFYFDFSMMPHREWRISHALSHHLYTNTVNDLEISSMEPFLQYLPTKKNYVIKYFSWIYSTFLTAFYFNFVFLKTLMEDLFQKRKLHVARVLPFSVLILMYLVSGQRFQHCLIMFLWIVAFASIHFAFVGLNAAHHHPDIFHDGDTPRPIEELDFGVYQLDAVSDRKEITGSHFLVMTNFGDHTLHHLFPTLDHGKLHYLYPIFLKTCQEFGLEWKITTQLELIKGQYQQLAKDKPNKVPPKFIKQQQHGL